MTRLHKKLHSSVILLVVVLAIGIFILFLQRPRFFVVSGTDVVVFSRRDELGRQIYVATVDGKQQIRITENINRVAWRLPLPNPFGYVTQNLRPQHIRGTNDILFESTVDGPSSLYSIGIDGRNQKRASIGSYRSDAVPSPDSTSIAYTDADGKLHVSLPDGSNDRCLTCTTYGYALSLAWSPNGRSLAFDVSVGDGLIAVYRIDVNGTNLHHLSPLGVNAVEPKWSSDGSRLAVAMQIQDGYRIFIMNADGTNVQQVTHKPIPAANLTTSDRTPTWSPDDNQLAFMSTRGGDSDIYVVKIDGTELRRVTALGDVSNPVWLRVQE